MFNTINAQQQPFIQSGYGAQAKLNTLLGIGGRPMTTGAAPSTYRPAPGGGVRMQAAPGTGVGTSSGSAYPDLRLRQILQLRAMQGDSDAIGQLQQGGG